MKAGDKVKFTMAIYTPGLRHQADVPKSSEAANTGSIHVQGTVLDVHHTAARVEFVNPMNGDISQLVMHTAELHPINPPKEVRRKDLLAIIDDIEQEAPNMAFPLVLLTAALKEMLIDADKII